MKTEIHNKANNLAGAIAHAEMCLRAVQSPEEKDETGRPGFSLDGGSYMMLMAIGSNEELKIKITDFAKQVITEHWTAELERLQKEYEAV